MLKVDYITVLADKGYYNGKGIFEYEQNDISCLVAKHEAGGFKKKERFFMKE